MAGTRAMPIPRTPTRAILRGIRPFPSGDIGTIGSNTDNSYRVVVSSGNSSTAILDGATITAVELIIPGGGCAADPR